MIAARENFTFATRVGQREIYERSIAAESRRSHPESAHTSLGREKVSYCVRMTWRLSPRI